MALQDSVKLLLLLVVALRTSAFNVDTTEPIVLQLDPGYASVHQVALQSYNNSTVRLFVETTNISSDDLRLQCFGRGYSKCTIDEGRNYINGDGNPSWNIILSSTVDSQEYQLELNILRDKREGAEYYQQWQDDDKPLGNPSDGKFCAADFDNDGKKDLVTGEPLFSQRDSSEEGRVLVFITNKQKVLNSTMINGSGLPGARFGTSVSCIGDINLDDFQDLAVGAPGEDDGRGAIYIYHGSASGIKQTYSQRIAAKAYKRIRGFGTSISNGVDIDQNHYLDLAVGASQSSHVVLLRTRPVIHLHGNFVTTTNMTVSRKRFVAEYCVSFTGQYLTTTFAALTKVTVFDTTTASEGHEISTRHNNVQEYKKSRLLTAKTPRCMEVEIDLKNFSRDSGEVLIPVLLKLEYQINEISSGYFCRSCPVLDPDEPNESLATGYISCAGNGTCPGEIYEGWPIVNVTEQVTSKNQDVTEDGIEDAVPPSTISVIHIVSYVAGGVVCLLVAVICVVIVCRRKRKATECSKTLVAVTKSEFGGVKQINNVYYTKRPLCEKISYDDASSCPVDRIKNSAKRPELLGPASKPGYSGDALQDSEAQYEMIYMRESVTYDDAR